MNIWSDPWLEREASRLPISPRRQCVLTTVNELIDPYTGQWDEMLVRNTLWDVDAKVVLATPIRDDFEDFPAWHYDSKGSFSVKSAYRVYVQKRDADVCTSSRNSDETTQWSKIWDLPCLPKVKQFVWRLAHNSLPLMTKIKKLGIECDTLCTCCTRLDENGAHLFLKCKEMKQLWEKIGMGELRDRMATYETAHSVVQEVLTLNDEQKVLIFRMMWRWWLRRNKENREGKKLSLDGVPRQARY